MALFEGDASSNNAYVSCLGRPSYSDEDLDEHPTALSNANLFKNNNDHRLSGG